MLPAQNRLTKKKDFDTVFSGGKSIKQGFLLAKLLKNNASNSRFGFVVSKKVSTKATVRNKIKRQLRSVVSEYIKEIKDAVDVVIITLPGIQKKEFSEIRQDITTILNKI